MINRLIPPLAVLFALLCTPSLATAATRELWPGVQYSEQIQLTSAGPVVMHVLTGPRPGGATSVDLLLSNESLRGRETVSSMQRRVVAAATAGINGDFSSFADGKLSGMFMRDGELGTIPMEHRSTAGILSDGTLEVRRAAFRATWRGSGALHPLSKLNEEPVPSGAALFTEDYGPTTPRIAGGAALVMFPFPLPAPGADLTATVVDVVSAGSPVSIPRGGAVLVAHGVAAMAAGVEAPVGAALTVRLDLKPAWPNLVTATGGGPVLVRNGKLVVSAGEWFTSSQIRPRAPRSAIGQLPDGRILLVAVDGRQSGLSVGLTNADLARAMVRLGAVTAMGLDGGGSTTMAFNGTVLNSPSDGRERPVGSALVFRYDGVYVTELPTRISPNGDGVADAIALSYRVVRPSSVSTELTAPDGTITTTPATQREPGTYPIASPTLEPVQLGPWKLVVRATDDLGQATEMTRSFTVDDTLGFLRVPKTLALPPGGAELPIAWTLAREALVTVTVRDARGTLIRSLLRRRLPAGDQHASWNGLDRNGAPVEAGRYTVRVAATGPVGTSELESVVRVRHSSV